MQASLTRTLGVAGLLAVSLTGCQSSNMGSFSWNPKNWKFGRKPDTALASNNAASEASPWQPTLPSTQATPGYGTLPANNSYAAAPQYGTGYPTVPTAYTADPTQNAWGAAPTATGVPATDPNAYAAAPTGAQSGYYDGAYGQPQQSGYAQPAPQQYGAPMAQQPMPAAGGYDPASQYGGAPTYPQQSAPVMQTADNSRYPSNTQYDGTQPSQYNAGQTNYSAPANAGYDNMPQSAPANDYWPPASQSGTQPAATGYPQQYQQQPVTQPAPSTQQPYRPGGTSDWNGGASSGVSPAGYESQQPAAGSY